MEHIWRCRRKLKGRVLVRGKDFLGEGRTRGQRKEIPVKFTDWEATGLVGAEAAGKWAEREMSQGLWGCVSDSTLGGGGALA